MIAQPHNSMVGQRNSNYRRPSRNAILVGNAFGGRLASQISKPFTKQRIYLVFFFCVACKQLNKVLFAFIGLGFSLF